MIKAQSIYAFFELLLILFCFSQTPKPIANETEVLTENEVMGTQRFYGLVIVVTVLLFATVIILGLVSYLLLRKKSTARVSITEAPSESPHETTK